MKLSLLIRGEDKRILIEPENSSDKKLLEFVAEHDSAQLVVSRIHYGNEIKDIELLIKSAPVDRG